MHILRRTCSQRRRLSINTQMRFSRRSTHRRHCRLPQRSQNQRYPYRHEKRHAGRRSRLFRTDDEYLRHHLPLRLRRRIAFQHHLVRIESSPQHATILPFPPRLIRRHHLLRPRSLPLPRQNALDPQAQITSRRPRRHPPRVRVCPHRIPKTRQRDQFRHLDQRQSNRHESRRRPTCPSAGSGLGGTQKRSVAEIQGHRESILSRGRV